jgi:hypothetical protein
MLRAALTVLCLGVLCAVGTAAPVVEGGKPKVDVSGTWKVEVELGGNTGNPEFTFKQTGNDLTGKYKGQFGEADVKGKVTGTKIEFSFSVNDMGKAVYTGTIDKDTMKGTVKYGEELSGTWTGKREKAK